MGGSTFSGSWLRRSLLYPTVLQAGVAAPRGVATFFLVHERSRDERASRSCGPADVPGARYSVSSSAGIAIGRLLSSSGRVLVAPWYDKCLDISCAMYRSAAPQQGSRVSSYHRKTALDASSVSAAKGSE